VTGENLIMSNKIDDGGPAFPVGCEPERVRCSGFDEMERVNRINTERRGMSLRDWYAGMAMQGFLAGVNMIGPFPKHLENENVLEMVVKGSFLFADAMIASRNKV